MKTPTIFLKTFIIFLIITGTVYAASSNVSFAVTATMSTATGINILTNSLTNTGSGNILSPVGSSLTFGNLVYTSFTDPVTKVVSNVWLPKNAFVIDVAPTGGSVSGTDVTLQYSDILNPNSANNGHGLGWKATITFVVLTSSGETPIAAHGGSGKMLLKDIPALGETITAAQIGSGTLRMYIGMITKDPSAVIPDPAQGELFTTADLPGEYTGELIISATIF